MGQSRFVNVYGDEMHSFQRCYHPGDTPGDLFHVCQRRNSHIHGRIRATAPPLRYSEIVHLKRFAGCQRNLRGGGILLLRVIGRRALSYYKSGSSS